MSQLTDNLLLALTALIRTNGDTPASDVRAFETQVIAALGVLEARARGNNIHVTSGVPADALGMEGDVGVNKDNGDVYRFTGGAFDLLFNIMGQPGLQGPKPVLGVDYTIPEPVRGPRGLTGPKPVLGVDYTVTNGADGADGAKIFDETYAPDDATGKDGDEWYHSKSLTAYDRYFKIAGKWKLRYSGTGTVVTPPANAKPVIVFNAPASGATVTVGQALTLTATATDDVSVATVEFINGVTGASLGMGNKNGTTYTLGYTPTAAGSLSLVAKATDGAGLSDQATVTIAVQPATVTPTVPTVTFNSQTRILTAVHPDFASSELETSQAGGAYAPYAALSIDAATHAAGEWMFRVKQAANRNVGPPATSPAIAPAAGASKVQIIGIGDSIVYGASATNIVSESWVPLIGSKFPATWDKVARLGYPGEHASQFTANHMAELTALLDSSADTIFVLIAFGANDLNFYVGNANPSAAFLADYKALHAAVRNLNPKIKTVSLTLMNRVDSDTLAVNNHFNIDRQNANDAIIANASSFADAVISLRAQPLLDDVAAGYNPDNFADGVHPTSRGHALYANVVLPRLSALANVMLGTVPVPAAPSAAVAPLSYTQINRSASTATGIKSIDIRALDGTNTFDFMAWGKANRKIVVANGSAGIRIPFESGRAGAAFVCLSETEFVDGDTFSKAFASVYLTASGPHNVAVFQGATAVSPATARPTDISLLVDASGIKFYQTDVNTPFYTITAAVPANLFVYVVLYHQDSALNNATIEGQGIVVLPSAGGEEFLAYSTQPAVRKNVAVTGAASTTRVVKSGGADWSAGVPATRALQAGCRFKLGAIAASGQGQRVEGTTRTANVGTVLSPRYGELEYSWYLDDSTVAPAMANLAAVPGAAANVPPAAGMQLEIFFSADGTRVDWVRDGTVVATLSPASGVVFPQVPEVAFRLDNTDGVIGASLVGANLVNSGF